MLKISGINIEQDRQPAPWMEESVHGDPGPMLRLRIGDPGGTISGRHAYTLRFPAGQRPASRPSRRRRAIGGIFSAPLRFPGPLQQSMLRLLRRGELDIPNDQAGSRGTHQRPDQGTRRHTPGSESRTQPGYRHATADGAGNRTPHKHPSVSGIGIHNSSTLVYVR